MLCCQLINTKTQDGKQTLMHFLVDTIEKRFPDMMDFARELLHVEQAARGLCLLVTWKTLHTARPPYLSELLTRYIPSRALRSSNTNLSARPSGITSNFNSVGIFCFCSIHLELTAWCLHTSTLLIKCQPSDIQYSLLLSSSHPVLAPRIHLMILALFEFVYLCMYWCWCCCLQCFDTVGWASGRASGL